MEKFGLFDLIEKFNSVANGKTDFEKSKTQPQKKDGNEGGDKRPTLIDPMILPPVHYLMNTKMQDFCSRHEGFKKGIRCSGEKHK